MEETSPTSTTSRDPAPGRLSLVQDFVNTFNCEEDIDDWTDLDALAAWLRARGLIGSRERLAAGDLDQARALREALRVLLDDRTHARDMAAATRTLNAIPSGALMRVSFAAGGEPRLEAAGRGLDGAFAELLAIIERASCDGTWERMKVCADDTCRWAFYDHSKNRSGSWCSMAVCGNRAKVRSFRERRRAAPREP